MQKYIAEVKRYFSMLNWMLDTDLKKTTYGPESVARIKDAKRIVAQMEQDILGAPYGVLWVDLAQYSSAMRLCDLRAQENLTKLFVCAYKKSPVAHARDVKTMDVMVKMMPAMVFGGRINPNTMNLAELESVPVESAKKVFADTRLRVGQRFITVAEKKK